MKSHCARVALLLLFAATVLVPTKGPASARVVERRAAAVTTGASQSCVLTRHGGVVCASYQGIERVSGLSDIRAMSAGKWHTCVLTHDRSVLCWGDNLSGQIGDGTQHFRRHPVPVVGLPDRVVAIDAGGQTTCALLRNGRMRCWGSGPLGDGTARSSTTPVRVRGIDNVVQVSVGGYHICALRRSGKVSCWGNNYAGQLGDGTLHDRLLPKRVENLPNGISEVAAGGGHTCAMTPTGSAKCWGYNGGGQLGDGTWVDHRTLPVRVVGLPGPLASIAAGAGFTCAVTDSGAATCWGNDYSGGLGDGSFRDRNEPVDVVGLSEGVLGVAAGSLHACAVLSTGGVRCWGYNEERQLGDGTSFDRPIPISMRGFIAPTARFRPDLLVARRSSGPWIGDDIYERHADVQTLRVRVPPGERRALPVEVQNDTDELDHIFLEGTSGTREIGISYGGTGGSAKLGRRWIELGPRATAPATIAVRVANDAAVGTTLTVKLRARSASDCTKVDQIRVTLVVRTD